MASMAMVASLVVTALMVAMALDLVSVFAQRSGQGGSPRHLRCPGGTRPWRRARPSTGFRPRLTVWSPAFPSGAASQRRSPGHLRCPGGTRPWRRARPSSSMAPPCSRGIDRDLAANSPPRMFACFFCPFRFGWVPICENTSTRVLVVLGKYRVFEIQKLCCCHPVVSCCYCCYRCYRCCYCCCYHSSCYSRCWPIHHSTTA